MTIDYLGQKFVGDLLNDGKIKSQETNQIFATPSAWAVSCKKIINPDKKSGCGWASVRYKGRKLDWYKSIWVHKRRPEEQNKENESLEYGEMEVKPETSLNRQSTKPAVHQPRLVVKHSILGNRIPTHDPNVLVESTTFTSLGKIQPFLITLSTNAALLIDYHCHLTTSEVTGYLAGIWDINTHNLSVTNAFPCKCRLADFESAPKVERGIRKIIEANGLSVVGWYHSHPRAPAAPSLRDIDTQLDYELRMKGSNDSMYIPCIGVICSPYYEENTSLESSLISYWVMPPPENRPHEYGKPMLMSYSVQQDNGISYDTLLEMKKLADFYLPEKDYIEFPNEFTKEVSYLEKIKSSLSAKFPKQIDNEVLWSFIKEVISIKREKTDDDLLKQIVEISSSVPEKMPIIPKNKASSKSKMKSPWKPAEDPMSSLNNYFMGSDIASALFKYPSSLMGLDPTAKSLFNLNTLSLSSMFLPPMTGYKSDSAMGLMKPPPPPSSHYSSSSPARSSPSSRSSPSKSRSSPSRTSSKTSSSATRESLSKMPKLDVPMPNFLLPSTNISKNCTITSRPSSSN